MSELKSEFLCKVDAYLDPPLFVGPTPHGVRVIAYIKSGTVEGPKIKGKILPGGGDWLLFRPDGAGELDVRGAMKTDDGQIIYTYYRGILSVPPDIMGKIQQGVDVDPKEYYFRTSPVFEASSPKYAWLNKIVCVGVGIFQPNRVRYDIYEIL